MSRYCQQCGKAHVLCVCKALRPVANRTPIIILQHPSEVNRPLGTAVIAKLGLENCRIFVGENFDEHPLWLQYYRQYQGRMALLYPAQGASFLQDWYQYPSKMEFEQQATSAVIILDGTWKKAYKMWQLSRCLHSLPLVKLSEDLVGNYRIRKAPRANALSTIEAIMAALHVIEPALSTESMDHAFQQMIETHLSHLPEQVRNRINGS